MGQSVLEISGSGRQATIRAGINDKHGTIGSHRITITPKTPMTAQDIGTCQEWVKNGVQARSAGGPLCKPDEHWLQAVLETTHASPASNSRPCARSRPGVRRPTPRRNSPAATST